MKLAMATITDAQLEKFLHDEWLASRRGGPRPECPDELTGRRAERRLDPRRVMARQIEQLVRERLKLRGYSVTGTPHQAKYDLLVEGVRVEVKAATWNGECYQANLHSNRADVLVWGCLDGALHWFVIPFAEMRGRKKIEISRHDPRDTIGQWLRFYEAWEIIDEFVSVGCNAWQPALEGLA